MGDQQRQRYQVQLSLRQKYQQQLEQLRRDSEQKGTYNTDDYRKAEQALTESLNRQLNENRRYWQQLEIAQGNWKNGAMRAFQNFTADADNAAGTAEQMLTAAFNSAGNALATFCTTGKLNFKSFTASLLSDLAKIMAQMSMMQAVKGIGSAFGWGSAATASVTPNADGGVYQSADLSRYSGTVVNRPTFFAFAKGAGVMGEAGPEAILPLRRGADGKLGVVADKAWTYNRSNVVMPDDGAPFRYSFSALKDRHNAVEVNWIDPNNGWETATELVEDTQAIARYGRNVTKMDAFGCTSRGQAHRAGLWLIKTELLETQTVDFSVGAEGLRHVPGDVIEICDDDYAGISTGGRVLAVNSQTRTLTLDREITLPSSGTALISLVDGSGNPVSVEVQSVTDGVKVKVSRVPDGVAEYSVWGLKLPTLRQRLFRCVSIRENDDGTYAITAVQHVPEKEAIVDNGAHFDGEQSGTVNGVTPPAVQHLTAEVTADSGEYQVLARWDTPKVVKGVSFLLRLTVTADDGSERLVSTARTTETTYRFTQLALGNYRLTVRAVNAWGQQGDPASVSFRIAAPAAPSRIELTPGYFQITATPHLAVYDPTVQFEFWFSEKQIADIRQVETSARYLGTALYWIAASINIKPGHDYYFYIRSVNTVGKSAFVEAVGRASDDAEGYLDFFKGKITESHLGKELLEKVELTEDNASRLEEFSKEWKDANDKWNAMWAVKIEQTKDGKHYVAGIGLSMEDTEEGKLSQFLVAANRIAFIDPANGNETPMFVAQGNQIFMNDVFLKRLTAPTITSGGNPPAFSLTPDGKLTAKNADISGSVNANSGTLSNVTIAENCTINGTLRAEKIVGDIVKAASAAFPRQRESSVDWPSGTRTVTVTDDHPFDRQIVVLPLTFRGSKRTVSGRTTYSMCYLKVLMNGAVIYDGAANEAVQVFSRIVDMPAGRGNVILTFTLTSTRHSADIPPDTFASDVQVMVIKKQALGISVV